MKKKFKDYITASNVQDVINQIVDLAVKDERDRIVREVEKKKLPIPNPYGNVVRVKKYNEVMDSLISLIQKK